MDTMKQEASKATASELNAAKRSPAARKMAAAMTADDANFVVGIVSGQKRGYSCDCEPIDLTTYAAACLALRGTESGSKRAEKRSRLASLLGKLTG